MRYENSIRQANVNDLEEIMRIWKSVNIEAHKFIPSDYWENNYSYVKSALPQSEIYVSIHKNDIAGFIGLSGSYIEGLFVKHNQQRKGFGRALLNKIKEIKPALTLKVYKKNINAVNFYLNNGFTITDEGVDESTNECEYTMQWVKNFV